MPKGVYERKPLAERLWAKIDKGGPIPAHRPELGPCWLWTGRSLARGHGQITENRRHHMVHRVVYELLIGPIPAGMTIDHICHNGSGWTAGESCIHRRCANPAHMELATKGENVLHGQTPAAINAAKTHCARNHAFDAANTRRTKEGKRVCRTCERDRARAAMRERRARHVEPSS
jgi:hypothetical protein